MILAKELRDLFIVSNAARAWWDRHCPVNWKLAEHIDYPYVNLSTPAERDLAAAVVLKIKDDAERAKGAK